MHKLTPKQKRFVDEYLVDLNATQAALRSGYSKKTAYSAGQRLLKKVEIQSQIANRQKDRQNRTEITQDRVLQEYAKLAFLQPKHFFNDDAELLPLMDMPDDVTACIAGIDISNRKIGDEDYETIKKIKLTDKKGALDSLAKHLGMFSDQPSSGSEAAEALKELNHKLPN